MSIPYELVGNERYTNRFNPFNSDLLLEHFHVRHHKWLARVRHLAVPLHGHCGLEMIILRSFIEWLVGFPDLVSVSFLIDHFEHWHRTGELVLYEPENVPITHLQQLLPLEIEMKISRSLKDYRDQFSPEWRVPCVEVLIMGFKRSENAFCVPQPEFRSSSESEDDAF